MPILDTAIAYDPTSRRCDALFDGQDLVLDATPVTPVLTIVGLDGRAHADDQAPDRNSNTYAPASLLARRGWAGDALDQNGQRTGCRLWLIRYAKQTEATRQLAQDALAEGLDPLATARKWPTTLLVEWARANWLSWRVTVADVVVSLNAAVGA